MGKKDPEFGSQANLVKNEAATDKQDKAGSVRKPPHLSRNASRNSEFETVRPDQKILTADEKSFLLNVERGDVAHVKRIVKAFSSKKNIFDLNCMDPLGRTGLIIAIENENLEMMHFLIEAGIEPRDAILVAIREDYVEGVECLLQYEEDIHKENEPYTWETVDQVTANFTPDVTPLILAAQRNNYEILKMLLDRGATIPMPHDVKCSCEECLTSSSEDSLRFSLARINAYKALASPSLIALSSKDPIYTAFQLSNELKRLGVMESQFKEEYGNLRKVVQEFAVGLISQARTSYELEVVLNHNPGGAPWVPGTHQTLSRLEVGIDANQKTFVAHPSVQQLLAAIWYDGLPGFRRLHVVRQIICVIKHACMFPIFSAAYILAPNSHMGQLARKPFLKFIFQSASYMFFLLLLALASQQIEHIIIDVITFLFPDTVVGIFLRQVQDNWRKYERGSLPTPIEMIIILWVQGLIWKSLKEVYKRGLIDYLLDLWNLADIFSYGSFMGWIGLRAISFGWSLKLQYDGLPEEEIWILREHWHPFDPMLLSEGLFGAGMISSYLKLIQIFSINPYLGPLQVSLGKMIIDICKFLVMYILVLFSFGCGLNQLLWYYADLEKQKCYSLPGGLPDWENEGDSCVMWRRFANLWETSQSLFWASFGLVELGDFELTGIKEFTRFWGLLMFGSYSVCNIIVLLNMLIAMMSTSYTIISERSDIEWKFARSKLWISYFEEGSTVPPPFNLIPTPKSFLRFIKCELCKDRSSKYTEDDQAAADSRFFGVMRCLVRRYVTSEQRKSENTNITEDDINEVRQDIRSFRYELINILRMNDMKTPNIKAEEAHALGKKSRNLERQIQKGFQISKSDVMGAKDIFAIAVGLQKQASRASRSSSKLALGTKLTSKEKFRGLAMKAVKAEANENESDEGPALVRNDPIGSTAVSIRRRNRSLRRSLIMRGNSQEAADNICILELNSDELVTYNPKLASFTPTTRIAYAKFKNVIKKDSPFLEEDEEGFFDKSPKKSIVNVENEKPNGQIGIKPKSGTLKASKQPSTGKSPAKASETTTAAPPITPEVRQPPKTPEIKSPPNNPEAKAMPKTPEAASKSITVTEGAKSAADSAAMPLTPKRLDESKTPVVTPSPTPTPSSPMPANSPSPPNKSPGVGSSLAASSDAQLLSSPKTVVSQPKITESPPPGESSIGHKIPLDEAQGQELKSTVDEVKTPLKTPAKSPKHPVVEVQTADDVKFDPKGKSVCSGKNITGWL